MVLQYSKVVTLYKLVVRTYTFCKNYHKPAKNCLFGKCTISTDKHNVLAI